MRLPEESKKRIIEAYTGDDIWLEQMEEEMKLYKETELTKNDNEYDHEQFENAEKLLITLRKMLYVMCEVETEDYAGKYYSKVQELYIEMKGDLTDMLGIEDMWEEI